VDLAIFAMSFSGRAFANMNIGHVNPGPFSFAASTPEPDGAEPPHGGAHQLALTRTQVSSSSTSSSAAIGARWLARLDHALLPTPYTRWSRKTTGVQNANQAAPWQLMMKCWKMNLRPGQAAGGAHVWRLRRHRALAWKLRKLNGPGFTWPMFMFANALPESSWRRWARSTWPAAEDQDAPELLSTIKPQPRQFLRPTLAICRKRRRPTSSPPPQRSYISLVPTSAA